MEVQGYIKRKITEEQRVRLQELSDYIFKVLNNKKEFVITEEVTKKFLYIPYKEKVYSLKPELETHGYFYFFEMMDERYILDASRKGENRITLARLFSGEEPLEAYLSPKLSQVLTNFIEQEEGL